MNPNDKSEVEGIFSGGDLTTLVDLQKFLAEELSQGAEKGVDLTRAFTPLTDGLGIHTTGTAATKAPIGATRAGEATFAPSQPVTEFRTQVTPTQAPRSPARLIIDPEVDAHEQNRDSVADDFALASPPPPVPSAGLGRRFMAGFVDQVFVLTAWLLAMAITSNAMSNGTGDLGTRFLREFSNPAFVRFALLEFGMIWLGYLTLSFGFLEMTFGMWVWGLRVNYGDQARFWKKLARVVSGMFFYPAIVPSVILAIRKEGRHLIDMVTQSSVYRTMQS